jgi:hypothetical protein
MLKWDAIYFAEGESYKLNKQDILLFANTGIWDILNVKEDLELGNTYIPRYVYTFKIFMHCLRGYDVDIYYIGSICKSTNIYIKHMITMLSSDNIVYKVPKMVSVLENLSYTICPKTLTDEQLRRVYDQKSENYRDENEALYSQIQELCEETPTIPLHTPIRRLQKYYKQLCDEKRFDEFKTEVNVKLPYMLIAIVKIISEATEKPISDSFEYNIKQRIRNDPDLARELYTKLNDANILNIVSVCLSCLSAFVE